MADESLADLLDRLQRERDEADRRYNDALTALDRAQPSGLGDALPVSPTPYDDSQLPGLNQQWQVAGEPPAGLGTSIKGRLRRFVWNLVGPVFGAQQRFNATLVDHLNRNVTAHHEAHLASAAAVEALTRQASALAAFHSHLIQYLQSVTPYVDTRDRSVGGQARVVGAGLSAVTDTALKRWESVQARDQRFLDRVAALDDVRTTATLAQQTALSLKRDVERLAARGATGADADGTSAAGAAPLPAPMAGSSDASAFKYVGFEDQFRGSQDEIRRRLTDYVERFSGRSDIIDIGCGRGEFLALLAEHGIAARGVDLNAAMVETARERGLDVRQGDALAYLETLDDDSVGGVFGAQVAEHLDPSYLDRLVDVARRKLRAGGLLVLETINPACWAAFFDSYLRDLTHVRALHPETLQFVLRANGFHSVDVEFRSPVPQHARLETVPVPETTPGDIGDLLRAFNDNVEKLNARMFTHQDYAVTGRK